MKWGHSQLPTCTSSFYFFDHLTGLRHPLFLVSNGVVSEHIQESRYTWPQRLEPIDPSIGHYDFRWQALSKVSGFARHCMPFSSVHRGAHGGNAQLSRERPSYGHAWSTSTKYKRVDIIGESPKIHSRHLRYNFSHAISAAVQETFSIELTCCLPRYEDGHATSSSLSFRSCCQCYIDRTGITSGANDREKFPP